MHRHTGTHCVENSEKTWLHWILVGARVHSWGVVKASCLQTLVVINHSECNHDDYCDDDLWKSPWNSIHLMLGFFRGAQPFQRARWTERCGHLRLFAHYWVDQPMQLPKRSKTYFVKVRDTVSNIFTYWTCLASSFVLTDHLVCRVKGRKVDLGEIYWAKLNSKASYTSTLVTNNLEVKAKHLKFVLVPAVNQHLLKSLPPLDFMRKIGGSCLMMMRDLRCCLRWWQLWCLRCGDLKTWNVMLLVSLVPSITTTTSNRCLVTSIIIGS